MSGGPDGFEKAALADQVLDGQPLGVELAGGRRVCLVRDGEEILAVADECAHQAFPLSAGEVLPGGTIECPWHGARFDCRTGRALRGPAKDPIARYEVSMVDDMVYVRVGGRPDGSR